MGHLEGPATIAAALGLLGYVAARAYRVPLSYDEAAAYIRYIATDPLSAFNADVATNHYLQTLLTKLSWVVFGGCELALRLPSVVSYGLYLAASVLILQSIRNRILAYAGFLLLNLNPYLLEWFGLARGYGLSLALLLTSAAFLVRLAGGVGGSWTLVWSIGLGAAAVAANFAALTAFLAICCVATGVLVLRSRTRFHDDTDASVPARREWRRLLWLPAAVLMSLLVFSQDTELSADLYEPVSVAVVGPDEAALGRVRVVRFDTRGRELDLRRDGNRWSRDTRMHVAGLRITMPTEVAGTVDLVEVTIGPRLFAHRRDAPGPWRITTDRTVRVFDSALELSLERPTIPALRGIINWRGGGVHSRAIARYTGAVVLAVALLGLVLRLGERAAARARLLSRADSRVLSDAVCWVAAISTAPLYLLARDEELYFGGSAGFVYDTLGSVALGWLYGHGPGPEGIVWVGRGVLLWLALAAALLGWLAARGRTPAAGLAILTVLVLLSAGAILQHVLFGTPYPVGRTALFFVPLAIALFVHLLDSLASGRRQLASILQAAVVGAAAVALVHFARVANMSYVYDWRNDASTKAMMGDLASDARRAIAEGRPLTLGVDAIYYPVATYYAGRVPGARISVLAGSGSSSMDYLYLPATSREPWMRIIAVYPRTATVLISNRDR